jgi:hypothetical protein
LLAVGGRPVERQVCCAGDNTLEAAPPYVAAPLARRSGMPDGQVRPPQFVVPVEHAHLDPPRFALVVESQYTPPPPFTSLVRSGSSRGPPG